MSQVLCAYQVYLKRFHMSQHVVHKTRIVDTGDRLGFRDSPATDVTYISVVSVLSHLSHFTREPPQP